MPRSFEIRRIVMPDPLMPIFPKEFIPMRSLLLTAAFIFGLAVSIPGCSNSPPEGQITSISNKSEKPTTKLPKPAPAFPPPDKE
jgi:hypothetical protein